MRERYSKDKLSDGQLALLQTCNFDFHGLKGAVSSNKKFCTNIEVATLNNDLNVDSNDEEEMDDKNDSTTNVCREYNNIIVYFSISVCFYWKVQDWDYFIL